MTDDLLEFVGWMIDGDFLLFGLLAFAFDIRDPFRPTLCKNGISTNEHDQAKTHQVYHEKTGHGNSLCIRSGQLLCDVFLPVSLQFTLDEHVFRAAQRRKHKQYHAKPFHGSISRREESARQRGV
jgi:hypothetical protein